MVASFRRQRLILPIAPVVSGAVGLLTALAFALLPIAGIEQAAVASGLAGVLQYDTLDAEFGSARVLGGLCQINATLGAQGQVRHLGQHAAFVYGERAGEPRSARCVALETALTEAAFSSRLSSAIQQDVWEKYVFLTTLAAATCLMRGPVGQLVSTQGGEAIVRDLLRECQQVAAASGHTVRAAADAAALKVLIDPESTMTASMFRDLSHGARVEADHIVGDMVQRGRVLGLDAPALRMAYAHLQVYQAQRAIGA